MLHLLAHLLFAVGILRWLTWELKRPFQPLKHSSWVAGLVFFSVAGLFLSELSPSGQGTGNFLLHAVGGGMATAITFEYLRRSLRIKLNWRLELAMLFLFVSGFGILNELAEYAAELVDYGIFSIDSQDTWRDFVANTSGAISSWTLIRLFRVLEGRK